MPMPKNYTIEDIVKALNKKGYVVFENDKKPFNLNIIGVRNSNPKPDVFNDLLFVFWKYQGRWSVIQMDCTTESGLHWLKYPLNKKGTAILKEGQWKGMWSIGLHQGKYKALKQAKPVTVIRDFDKDGEFDYDSGVEDTGLFGINCHRANAKRESIVVGKWSAGCQVVQNPHEFDLLVSLCEEAAEVHGNSFTYTLINQNDIQ